MNDEVLETYVRRQIEAQQGPEIYFLWQGGEPTLAGLDFYERAVALQERYIPAGRRIVNALQSNGMSFTDDWASFLAERGFLVGLSLDGPAHLHDVYRLDHKGRPTHARVIKGLEILQHHGVEVNSLTTLNAANARHPLKVYQHLKELGINFMQFIPIVERLQEGGCFAEPPADPTKDCTVADFCASPKEYGNFMCTIFDEWVRKDVGKIFVQMFDGILAGTMGRPIGLCLFAETCGDNLAMESNGDLYACDHYVYPQYLLGNIFDGPLSKTVSTTQQKDFGLTKKSNLPKQCRACEYLSLCNGGCPKHRFMKTRDGEQGLNYLCHGYQQIFRHTAPTMQSMGTFLSQGRLTTGIMHQESKGKIGRNDPCLCGSGIKFKKCCG